MKAVIFGITGQDGSYLAELLLAKGYEVHGAIRRASTWNTGRIDGIYLDPHEPFNRLTLHHADLLDAPSIEALLAKTQPDEIYNLAAQSHVAVSFGVPEFTLNTSAGGTLRLLEATRRVCPKARLYHAGSSEMFGSSPPPQNEDTPFRPCSPYGVAKVAAHQMCSVYRDAYKIWVASGILFNHECVTAETPVIVRRRGIVDIVPIEEIVPHRTNPRHGTKYTAAPAEPLEVWDRNAWAPVTLMTATWSKGREVVDVRSRSAIFTTTPEHVIFKRSGEDEVEVPSGEIAQGDQLCFGTPADCTPAIVMTAEEARLLGCLVADGYIEPEGRGARVTKNDDAYRAMVGKDWASVTGGSSRPGITSSGYSDRPVKTVELTCASNYLRWIRPEIYTESQNKRIPIRILNASAAIQMEFLRAYNMGDGLKAGYGTHEFKCFKSNSPTLLAGLWWLTSRLLEQPSALFVEDRGEASYFSMNLNVPLSRRVGNKGCSLRKDKSEVVRVRRREYTGWLFDLETKSGTFHAGIGDGWIHNSPRRGENFVTRKTTRAIGRILAGTAKKLYLGNLDAVRDWGFAGDYVRAMWLMLQPPEPRDYVVATGEAYSVKQFVERAFQVAGLDWKEHVVIEDRYLRPKEVPALQGDSSRIRRELGWVPEVKFDELVSMMVRHDIELARAEATGSAEPIAWDAGEELGGIPVGTAEQERRRAKGWMNTAALHCRNETYWRERAERAEAGKTV